MRLAELIVGESYYYCPYQSWATSLDGARRAVLVEPGLWVAAPAWTRSQAPRPAGKGERGKVGVLVDLYLDGQSEPDHRRTVVPTSQLRGPWAETHAQATAAQDVKLAAYRAAQDAAAGAQQLAREILAGAARHGIDAMLVRSPEWQTVEMDVFTLRRLVERLDQAERVLGERIPK